MKLCLHGLVYLDWIMDYVPFVIFLLYLYMYLLCDNKWFWTLNLNLNYVATYSMVWHSCDAWCPQVNSPYLNQYWPISMTIGSLGYNGSVTVWAPALPVALWLDLLDPWCSLCYGCGVERSQVVVTEYCQAALNYEWICFTVIWKEKSMATVPDVDLFSLTYCGRLH